MTFGSRKPTVVGGEDYDRAAFKVQALHGVEDSADRGIQLFEHRGVGGVVLNEAYVALPFPAPCVRRRGLFLLLVFLDEVSLRANRNMDRKERQVSEKLLVPVRFDEADRFTGDSVRRFRVILGIRRRLIAGWIKKLSGPGQARTEALGVG